MKRCRGGFIRCSRRDGPCGSHQLEARREKCESSWGSIVEGEGGVEGRVGVVENEVNVVVRSFAVVVRMASERPF